MVGNLAPQPVAVDSTNDRQHRGLIAQTLNTVLGKLYKAATFYNNAAVTDASISVTCLGNAVLLTGFANVAAGAATFTLKRDAVVIATFGNLVAGKSQVIAWLDNPGVGTFAYTTNSGGFTNSSALSAVELK